MASSLPLPLLAGAQLQLPHVPNHSSSIESLLWREEGLLKGALRAEGRQWESPQVLPRLCKVLLNYIQLYIQHIYKMHTKGHKTIIRVTNICASTQL